MRRFILCFAIPAIALLVGACSRESSSPQATDSTAEIPRTAALPPQNLLFIVLDAFDAGHVSHLGYPEETTPNLDALAASGVTFSNAHSQSSSTNSSVKSYFTGRYPAKAHATKHVYGITPKNYTLAQAFQNAGFSTAGYSENPWVQKWVGSNQGFEEFVGEPPVLEKDESRGYTPRDQEATTRLISSAREWIASRESGERWFCYLHLFRPHNPYTVPESFASQLSTTPWGTDIGVRERRLISGIYKVRPRQKEIEARRFIKRYDTNIQYVDHLLGEMIDWLEEGHLSENTLIIVASDHGEAFLQHDKFGHNTTLYEEMIHVPLVFKAPSSTGLLNVKIDHPVEMVDLFPTLAELFSLSPRDSLDGKSLMPYLLGERNPLKETLFSLTQDNSKLAVRHRNHKLILVRVDEAAFIPHELFDLSKDPAEQHNLIDSSEDLERLNALAQSYLETYFIRTEEETPAMSQAQIDILKALGYLE